MSRRQVLERRWDNEPIRCKKRTLMVGDMYASSFDDVFKIAPWAAVVITVDDGWMAFESGLEADVWLNHGGCQRNIEDIRNDKV